MQVELRGERLFERRRARPARVDERAINVEQYKPDHAPQTLRAGAP
jgi:hypothetical protein